MATRSGPNGGTFRVTEIKPRERLEFERLDEYLGMLAASALGGEDRTVITQRPPRPLPPPPVDDVIEPKRIEVDGLRWAVARVTPGTERRIARDLADEGFRPYCPLGRKLALRARVKGSSRRQRRMRQFAVFSPYLFVGCIPGHEIGRDIFDHWGERVGTVISDVSGPTFIAPRIIAEINKLEVAGQWWDDWAAQTHLRPGAQVLVTEGPFVDMRGIVESLPAEMRVTVDLNLFGRGTPVTLDACQINLV
jgi:transcription antitermination factor NusG